MPSSAAEPRSGAEELAGTPEQFLDSRPIDTQGHSLRQHAARGTLITGCFQVALASLTFVQAFIVAAFLSRRDYGIWGILLVALGTIQWLKGRAVSEKYVQQSHSDQERQFQIAFTIELFSTLGLAALMALSMPLIALVYGQWRVVAPGLVLAFGLVPSIALQAPQWVFYRNMDFVPQRLLQAVTPVVGFIATVVLAIAGAGYWSLVLGALVGSLAGGAISVLRSPYRLAWRFDRRALREYFCFSWPITIAGAAAIGIAQGSLLVVNVVLGLAAVGAVALASQIVNYTDGVDAIVSDTLYPAICAIQDRTALQYEAFVKSNRLALMWGVPFGVGVALFAPQLVRFVIGERWHPAIGLIQIFGLAAAAHQIGFNWSAFYSARGDTRPIAIVNVVLMLTLIASAIPLTIVDGLTGLGFAMLILTAAGLVARAHYLSRLFPGFRMWLHMLRAIAPTIPAAACVLLLRAATGAPSTLAAAIAELAAYALVTLAGTWLFERALLREVVGYVRRGRGPARPLADRIQFGV
jgi:O-antigen/teichoic acid export membrane protein